MCPSSTHSHPLPTQLPSPDIFFWQSCNSLWLRALVMGLWKGTAKLSTPPKSDGGRKQTRSTVREHLRVRTQLSRKQRQPLAPSPSEGGQKKGTSKARWVKVRRAYLNRAKRGNGQTARDAQCTTYHGCHHAAPWLEKTIPSLAGRPLQALGMTSVWYRICHRLVWSSCPGCGN